MLTVFTRISAAALIKFFVPQMRRLLEGSACEGGTYLKIGHGKEKNAENRLLAQVTGKRKIEVGLVVPASSEPSQQNYVLPEFWIENLMGER